MNSIPSPSCSIAFHLHRDDVVHDGKIDAMAHSLGERGAELGNNGAWGGNDEGRGTSALPTL